MAEEKVRAAKKSTEQMEILESTQIQGMIYVIRGKQVMLDSDLALLYQVETRVLNQAVKRNITRFPENFRFQLTDNEYQNLISQFVISSFGNTDNRYGGRRKLPYVFTEQGIAMLSAVLKSEIAIQVSIRIMETFVETRKYMDNTTLLYDRMNEIEQRQISYQNKTNERFDRVFEYIADHEESQQKIFYEGQIYDAFSLLVDFIRGANKNIVLVDNYIDIGTLNILAKKQEGVNVTIYTDKRTKLTEKDVETFNQQYPKLEVRYTVGFHDRFLIIDNTKAYHIGASLKDAGKKCFAISILNDKRVIYDILQRLNIEFDESAFS
ncbi:MAG: ORF6N domain-containing protein [Hungatella hathewayi]|nr:ORF6N domain-containing protein [Hungatella hathewayi]